MTRSSYFAKTASNSDEHVLVRGLAEHWLMTNPEGAGRGAL